MDIMDTLERRSAPRVPFIEDVFVHGSMGCRSSDISEGGIFISAIQAFDEGTALEMMIPFRGDELTVRGEIRHHQHGIGVGTMFVDLTDSQREKIHDIIEAMSEDTC
jgi:hypothetical protein